MKCFKLSVLAIVSILGTIAFVACSKDDYENEAVSQGIQLKSNNPVTTFIESQTFRQHAALFSSYGRPDTEGAKAEAIEYEGYEGEYINLPILNSDGKTVAALEVVNLNKTGCLPNKDTYAINLIDYRDYDLSTNTGTVKMIDVNYDHLHSIISVEKNEIKQWEHRKLERQYAELKKPSGIYQLCDSNHNNNISFGECYKCAQDAIESNGYSNFICDIPVAGWASCWASVSATCVYVSSVY